MDRETQAEVLIERLKIFWKATTALSKKIDLPSFGENEEAFCRHKRSPLVFWFKSLPHLHLPEGMVPDFYHSGTVIGSEPVLYVRKKDSPRLADYHGRSLAGEEPQGTLLLSAVVPEKSIEGIWELILLDEMGDQFALWWHAGDHLLRILYDWGEFFKGKTYAGLRDCEECLFMGSVTENTRLELLSWNVTPYINMKEDRAIAHYCVFMPFEGFFKIRRTIILSPEIKIKKPVILKKVEYDCGIIY